MSDIQMPWILETSEYRTRPHDLNTAQQRYTVPICLWKPAKIKTNVSMEHQAWNANLTHTHTHTHHHTKPPPTQFFIVKLLPFNFSVIALCCSNLTTPILMLKFNHFVAWSGLVYHLTFHLFIGSLIKGPVKVRIKLSFLVHLWFNLSIEPIRPIIGMTA